ncbi:hypothetical protein TWF102_002418 [Orbilia oligospora]|uniref:HMG box domain-containing protein n=2 Tax=Orbilia oligospora TaxID=2813651 RepID=A0A7C8IXK5_ORBOL|nr:hypothetical protein TWF102_002418 [Orbilia oligospora]KAF3084384.1 hypothetical protein TWF706_000780 [Orbilia oligospora]
MGYIFTQLFDNSHKNFTIPPSEYISHNQSHDIRVQEYYKFPKPYRPPPFVNGMPPRSIQPKGVSESQMSSSHSSTPPAHICLCQPTPKIPRPRNAFILFRQHHHSAVMAQNPGKPNPAISKIIGDMWKNATEDTRKEWQNHADEEKRQHMARYPDYRYQPRRSNKKGNNASSRSPNDSAGEPSRCSRCGGRTGAYSITDSYPILPIPTVTAPSMPGGPSRSGSIHGLLGPSSSPFGRQPSPGEHKRKRSDEVGYHHGAEALLQLGSHERDYPSRSMAPPTSTTITSTTKPPDPPERDKVMDTSPPRSLKRRRIGKTITIKDEKDAQNEIPPTSSSNLKVNTITSRTATSPAMSYQSDLPLAGDRRASDPANYRQFQQRHETSSFSTDYLEPHHYSSPQMHMQQRNPTATDRQQPTTSTPTLPGVEKIQQIQRITRPLSNRSLAAAGGPGQSPLLSSAMGRTFLISVEVGDSRLAAELSFILHSELLERFRTVVVHQLMDITEWRQFLQHPSASGPEDLASDYLRAVAAARRQFEAIVVNAAVAYEQGSSGGPSSGSSAPSVASPWDQRDHRQPLGPPGAQFRSPQPIISILQQYILTHSATARRRLSPNGNVSPVYTSEWCIDVWRGSPRPNVTITVRSDDPMGPVQVEDPALGLISIPPPTGNPSLGGKPWKSQIIRRLAFEITEFITSRYGSI